MNFYLSNPVLDEQITKIRQKIRLAMNGDVSEKMTQYGIVYKQNYGVSIPRLREIAKQYTQNHDLAQRLWALKIRETMILATLLADKKRFSRQNAFVWLTDCSQPELIEQICMNLFCRLPYANHFCIELLQSEKNRVKTTGFMLSARISEQLNDEEIKFIVSKGIENSTTEEFYLYKSIALSFSRISRKSRRAADFILNKISLFENSDNIVQKYIWNEVKGEIEFLANRNERADFQSSQKNSA